LSSSFTELTICVFDCQLKMKNQHRNYKRSESRRNSTIGLLVALGVYTLFTVHAKTEKFELTVQYIHTDLMKLPMGNEVFSNYTFYGEEKPQLECLSDKKHCSDQMIKNDIMSKLPVELRSEINLTRTGPIVFANGKRCPRMSRKLDTACPYQIRHIRVNDQQKKQRLPNAIGLGTHKSGTGALAFLDCHPNLVIRILEPNAYPLTHKRLYFDNGQFLLPLTYSTEFLIEKSPSYAERFKRQAMGKHKSLADLRSGTFETVKRAREMKKSNPSVKLFIHVTDPVGRLYSQITQIFRPQLARITKRLKEHKTVRSAIEKSISYIKNSIDNSTENIVSAYIKELERGGGGGALNDQIGWYLRMIIQIGNYYDTIRDYEQVFGAHTVHVVDGHNEIHDPNDEFKRLLQFFNLDDSLIKFKFNEQKGFYCLDIPVKFCLRNTCCDICLML
jgi:hypothetical protein